MAKTPTPVKAGWGATMDDLGATIIGALQHGTELIEKLTPLATAIGGPTVGNVLNTINAIAAIGQNVSERISDGAIVLNTDDQATIRALIAKVADENDKLTKLIAAS